jgi:hypothetical protein
MELSIDRMERPVRRMDPPVPRTDRPIQRWESPLTEWNGPFIKWNFPFIVRAGPELDLGRAREARAPQAGRLLSMVDFGMWAGDLPGAL